MEDEQEDIWMTMIYTEEQKQYLADKAVADAAKVAATGLSGHSPAEAEGKVLDEAEKERLWNLVKAAVEGG